MPAADVSRFITPKIYGQVLANSWGPSDLPTPTDSWSDWEGDSRPKSQTSLRLDLAISIRRRKICGYIGHIHRIAKSRNTDPLVRTAVAKIWR